MSETKATLGTIKRSRGVAGQISYTVEATYPGEDPGTVTFVGSVWGGPIVMILPSGLQTFVSDAERFGTFGEAWVRKFFGGDAS